MLKTSKKMGLSGGVTQEAIAQRVGVSRRAVAYALNSNGRIGEEMRQRILQEAEAMGYVPNPAARALVTGRTNVVAVWTWSLASPYYGLVLQQLEHQIRTSGQEMMVNVMAFDDSQPGGARLSAWPVDGIFALNMPQVISAFLSRQSSLKTPIIGIGDVERTAPQVDTVTVDFRSATEEAMHHLIEQGIRRIAYLSVKATHVADNSRYAGYMSIMKKQRMKPELIVLPGDTRQSARKAIVEYIRQHGRLDGLFCHSDDIALGAYRGLCDIGLSVPNDIALIGCDGIDELMYLPCPMTTLEQPIAELCTTAWEIWQRRLNNPTTPIEHITMHAKLRVRQSSLRKN